MFSNTIRQSCILDASFKILNQLLFLVIPETIRNSDSEDFLTNLTKLFFMKSSTILVGLQWKNQKKIFP